MTLPASDRRAFLAGAGTSVLALVAGSARAEDRADLAAVFAEHGTPGTFVLLDGGRQPVAIDPARAGKRFFPASTFKVANSLVALETGVIASESEVIPYGGKPQPIKAWERDMSLREAIALSNVPVYQELARRIGLERYRDWLKRLGYGNRNPGTSVDTFWLDGPLEISAFEQAELMLRLAQQKLAVSARAQGIVRDIIRLETRDDATLYGKTGWCTACKPQQIGWLVGWVERKDRVASYALNIDMRSAEDAPRRVVIVKALLQKLAIYG